MIPTRRTPALASLTALALAALLPALSLAAPAEPGPVRAFMDTTCAPCTDFYKYANGTWLQTAELPPSYPNIGANREIGDRNQEALHEVLEAAKANVATEKDPTLRKLGMLYAVLMDSARADQEGAAPLAGHMKRIAAIQTKEDLRKEFANSALNGVGAGQFGGGGLPFRFGPEADPKESKSTIGNLSQGGLGLPDRDYYTRPDPRSEMVRKEYVALMNKAFVLLGDPADVAARKADAVFGLEAALAESSLAPVQMRDPHALYHKMTVKELGALCPAIDWPTYFHEVGVMPLMSPTASLDVSMPAFMRQVSRLMETTPMDTWRAYLQWNYARARANWLGQPFFDAAFSFTSKLIGTPVAPTRWKRASGAVDAAMGDALGKAYVEKYFPPASKARMLELVNNLLATMNERITKLDWMSQATKKQAVAKLEAIQKKIGYPDKWRDYAALDIDPKLPAVTNLERATRFTRSWQFERIGRTTDKTIWGMTPPTVNAYYNPPFNEIVFPAGILQPPQFDPRADDAVNYGAIGMVIGHEITHGFDDEGRQYDAAGNLRDWWTPEDSKLFDQRSQLLRRQYDGYVAVDTLHINGQLTLGENLADLGGATIAYYAWKRSLKGKPAPVINGFTGEQRFFLGFAQGWRRKLRPELTRLTALSDPHSPAVWRVNGVVVNMPEFAKAWGCKAGDPMVHADDNRVAIW